MFARGIKVKGKTSILVKTEVKLITNTGALVLDINEELFMRSIL